MRIKLSAFFFALFFLPLIVAGCNNTVSAPSPVSGSCAGGTASGKPATFAGNNNDGYTPLSASNNNATIGGTVKYEDKPFDENGFTGQTLTLPVRQAKVEVVDKNCTILATGATNDSGAYSITFDVSSSSGTVYVRALADSISTSSFSATVMDDTTSMAIYAVSSAFLSAGNATVNLIAGESGAGAAFNIFDMMITAQENVQSLSSVSTPQIDAYWDDGSDVGTYYYPQLQNGVFVPSIFLVGAPTTGSLAGDSDAYDDTVILHELGHYVAAIYSRDDSPGGPHALSGNYDLRLTWSEGWATFFGSMIRGSELYVDTSASGGFSFEIETPTPIGTGADNELAVATVLWDINDPANESFDTLSLGFTDIWDIFENRFPSAAVATFETFWDAWESYILSGQLTALLADRDIRYYDDQYEAPSDDTTSLARTVTPGISEQHTFFPESDKDYWKINVTIGTTYTFKTETLGDGADTVLTLYNSGGVTQLEQNDDDPARANDPEAMQQLASLIEFTASSNTTVYLMAEPYKPLVSGDPDPVSRYGYYTLTITAQ